MTSGFDVSLFSESDTVVLTFGLKKKTRIIEKHPRNRFCMHHKTKKYTSYYVGFLELKGPKISKKDKLSSWNETDFTDI